MISRIAFFLIGLIYLIPFSQCDDVLDVKLAAAEKLARDKAAVYQNVVDPGPTTLHIGLSLACADYNPRTHELTSRVFERYMWVDKRSAWKESDYAGIKIVHRPIERIWHPDVHVFNLHDNNNERSDVRALIFSNGTTVWVPPSTYKTRCSTERAAGKKEDTISCQLHLGSWTYNGEYMPLALFHNGGFDTYTYLSTCPYVISNPTTVLTDRYYPCCPEPYPTLDINFEVHRRPDDDDDDDKHHHARKPGWLDVSSTPSKSQEKEKSHWETLKIRKPRCYWPNCP